MRLRDILCELLNHNLSHPSCQPPTLPHAAAGVFSRTLELWDPPGGLALRVKLRPLLGLRLLSRPPSDGDRVRDLERGEKDAVRSRIDVRDLLRV